MFEQTTGTPELAVWTSGAGGGQVTPITPLPSPANVGRPFDGLLDVSGGRASADGSVFVFRTNSPLPGGLNDAGGFAQVYRYALATGLSCVSCPPTGVIPSGDAHLSYNNPEEGVRANGSLGEPMSTLDTRVMSSGGSRVFFDTPDPLVPQDTNGRRDVYEWESGGVSLISSGKSTDNSYLLDSSASGADVFFSTDSGLVAGDVDDTYDIYDARIPRPGDNAPPSAAACEGDACQGVSGEAPLPSAPASATFSGPGNLTPLLEAKSGSTSKKRKHHKRKSTHRKRHQRKKAAARAGKSANGRSR
jgi:hypothetical protein